MYKAFQEIINRLENNKITFKCQIRNDPKICDKESSSAIPGTI